MCDICVADPRANKLIRRKYMSLAPESLKASIISKLYNEGPYKQFLGEDEKVVYDQNCSMDLSLADLVQ